MRREPVWRAAWRVNRALPITLVVAVLLNVALFLFLHVVYEERASAVQKAFISLQAEERHAQGEGSDSELPQLVYTRSLSDLQTFRQAIPVEAELSGLVGELFTLAERAGMSIDRVRYNSTLLEDQDLLQYEIKYDVTGTYRQIKKMVHLIEQSGRIVAIDELSLGSRSTDKSVNMSLTLTTFFRTDKA